MAEKPVYEYNIQMIMIRKGVKTMSESSRNNDDYLIFEGEDGEEYSFVPLRYFMYNGEEYCLLEEMTDPEKEQEDEEAWIVCRVETQKGEDGEDEDIFTVVEDDEEADRLIAIATTRLDEEDEK